MKDNPIDTLINTANNFVTHEGVNIFTKKEFGYAIQMDKLNYILEQLINNFGLVIEENNQIYLVNEVEIK